MNYHRHLIAGASVLGLLLCTSGRVLAQATTNNIDAPNNANSTANPVVDLNQQGSLVNTQVNTYPLGRGVVGNGVADCSSSGIALSAFGNGIGPFDTGSIGGSFTYTHSFGMETCRAYAKTQLAKSNLETCLLLISNYSKMIKSGIKVSYEDLKQLAGINCPNVSVPEPGSNPLGVVPQPKNLNARGPRQPQQTSQQLQPVLANQTASPQTTFAQPASNQSFVQQQAGPRGQVAPQQQAQPIQRPAAAKN